MAIKLFERYGPDRANAPTTNYPQGSIKNESVPGANDGTPLDQEWGNDYAGFDAALFAAANATPDGNPDTALVSQRLQSLLTIHGLGADQLTDAQSFPYAFDGLSVHVIERETGSGGGGMWKYVPLSSVTVNGFNIVSCSGVVNLALELIVDDVLIEQFGAVNTIGIDSSPAIQAAVDYVNAQQGDPGYRALKSNLDRVYISNTLNAGLCPIDLPDTLIYANEDFPTGQYMVDISGTELADVSGQESKIRVMDSNFTRRSIKGVKWSKYSPSSTNNIYGVYLDTVVDIFDPTEQCEFNVSGFQCKDIVTLPNAAGSPDELKINIYGGDRCGRMYKQDVGAMVQVNFDCEFTADATDPQYPYGDPALIGPAVQVNSTDKPVQLGGILRRLLNGGIKITNTNRGVTVFNNLMTYSVENGLPLEIDSTGPVFGNALFYSANEYIWIKQADGGDFSIQQYQLILDADPADYAIRLGDDTGGKKTKQLKLNIAGIGPTNLPLLQMENCEDTFVDSSCTGVVNLTGTLLRSTLKLPSKQITLDYNVFGEFGTDYSGSPVLVTFKGAESAFNFINYPSLQRGMRLEGDTERGDRPSFYDGTEITTTVSSNGGTGGTGSAGAGNQSVRVNINGITYKLLHDGTV